MDLSKLTIITQTKDPLVQKMAEAAGANNQITIVEAKSNINQDVSGNLAQPLVPSVYSQLSKGFNEFKSGELNESDFKRKIRKLDGTLLESPDTILREQTKLYLLETLYWFIQLKILISTSTAIETFKRNLNEMGETEGQKINKLLDTLSSLGNFNQTNRQIDYKDLSTSVGSLLKLLLTDDLANPKYKIDSKMVKYLTNYRPTYLKEITVLFDLYSKVYDQISKDLVDKYGTKEKPFRSVKEIQPRFDMINRHILSSNLEIRIDYDLDLNKLQVDPGYDIKASELGLTKRLNQLNDWLVNGIVNIQTQINRLNNLKPVTSEGNQSALLAHANIEVVTKYHVWEILKDTSKFLETLKGITDGTGFITGVPVISLLDVLEVNY